MRFLRKILYPKEVLLEDQRVAAGIVTDVLLEMQALTKPDVSLDLLDEMAERMIKERGGIPCNKGYKPSWAAVPYPATLCCSVNFEVCHAPPRGRILKDGDIVTYDLGVKYKTGCGDAAMTVAVGQIRNNKWKRLMDHSKQALYQGIRAVRAGAPISDIGTAISLYATLNDYRVIDNYGGHYIGKEMHEDPQIPHFFVEKNKEIFLKEGDVICLEPMLTTGDGINAIAREDGWTVFCLDRKPVAMYEHMLVVTKDGCEILTKHIYEDN